MVSGFRYNSLILPKALRRGFSVAILLGLISVSFGDIQTSKAGQQGVSASRSVAKGPIVSIPTQRDVLPRSQVNRKSGDQSPPKPRIIPRNGPKSPGTYPWRLNITATVFWVGEDASHRNPVHNHKSSWDAEWRDNYGGFDNPEPTERTKDYRPRAFIPKLNPFYIALPYNDVSRGQHKPEASKVIPWFRKAYEEEGKSVCKGRWVQIVYNKRSCFAQWEDCGPFTTDDWPYVFGDKPPMNRENKGAAIDISPAVRDYLGIKGGTALVHWRFVEFHRIPRGPWSKWGDNNPFVNPGIKTHKFNSAPMTEDERLRRQQEAIQKKLLKDLKSLRRDLQW